MYKDATLFFSQDDAVTITNMVPMMDRINTMLSSLATTPLAPAIKHALTFACQLMDKYYSKTDPSNVYHITMGMYSSVFITYILSQLMRQSFAVLHPQLKLKYFQQHGWEKDWIKTAEGIIRDEFSKYMRVLPSDSTPPAVCFSESNLIIVHVTYILSSLRKTLSLKTLLTSPWMVLRRWMSSMNICHRPSREYMTQLCGGGNIATLSNSA